ncbi:glycosyltransferase family 10 domain-containing protein [Butyrivibrio sp. NC2007]|uniref:glycosyltransferase family 10 domain-containing protein n=1 Tax=Butyrivibrio sp. NC2007 TaxID=1280683 RepID=UPI0003B72454|nr:glycosyltransferase family 10 [Butyrivibrio sp. NC2007]
MKKITIGYTDIYPGFDPTNNIIYNCLKDRYDVKIADTAALESSSEVQYLFYSASDNRYLDYNCIRIFVTGENLFPNFNLCDYAVGFEHMDVGDRFYRLPIYLWEQYREDYDLLLQDRLELVGVSPEKRKFCGIVATNNTFADPVREQFFHTLSRYRQVDSGGKAYNNIGLPEGVGDKRAFLKNYKFSIAFENSAYPGYCTEKLMQAFSAGTVPIYWGDETAIAEFNEKAFINCCGLSMEEAVARVKEIDTNDELYLKMLGEQPLLDNELRVKVISGLSKWLYHIIDSDYESARRRPIHGKMAAYEENYKKRIRREEKLKSNKLISAMVWVYKKIR